MFTRSTILDFTGKKLTLSLIAHKLVDGQRPPYVHLASTRRHSRDRCSQASPIFRTFPLVYYTERKPKNKKKRGRPGNEANLLHPQSIYSVLQRGGCMLGPPSPRRHRRWLDKVCTSDTIVNIASQSCFQSWK